MGARRDRRVARWELALDRCAQPTVGPRRWGAYFACGFAGYLTGLTLGMALAGRAELALAIRLVLALVPPIGFLLASKAAQAVFGRNQIVFYQQAIVVVGMTVAAVAIAGGPAATALDLTALAVSTTQAFGRIGCFRVGCCHGRPARRGVAYRDEHARAGFPARWVGRRIAPIQLVEAAAIAALVATGVAIVVGGARPGTAACALACGYGAIRFGLELLRGDPQRRSGGGLSEAQWTAVVTSAAAACYRPAWWTIAIAAVLAIAAAVLVIARRTDRFARLWLTGADHTHELADAIERGAAVTTREGVKVSVARLPDGRVDAVLSRPGRPLPIGAVRHLAAQLGCTWSTVEVIAGRTPGLFHLVATPADECRSLPLAPDG